MDEFRAVVEAWLTETDTSQAELGRRSGIAQNVISRWLGHSPTRPTPANLAKLAAIISTPYEDLLRMTGYLPGSPRAKVDARRQARHADLDRWLTAVGPEYEDDYWLALKASHETNLRIFRRLQTAVSAQADTAVSAGVSTPAPRTKRQRSSPGRQLPVCKQPLAAAA